MKKPRFSKLCETNTRVYARAREGHRADLDDFAPKCAREGPSGSDYYAAGWPA